MQRAAGAFTRANTMPDTREHCVSESDTYEVMKAENTRLEAEVERLKQDVSDFAGRCAASEHCNLVINKRNYELTADLAAANAAIAAVQEPQVTSDEQSNDE